MPLNCAKCDAGIPTDDGTYHGVTNGGITTYTLCGKAAAKIASGHSYEKCCREAHGDCCFNCSMPQAAHEEVLQ